MLTPGVLLVTGRGLATSATELRPRDVDREFVMLYSVFSENASPLLQKNIDRFLNGVTPPDAADFEESNLKHAINGLMYCHGGGTL